MNNRQNLLPGWEYDLRAVRVSEFGAFLDAGTGDTADDILLHQAQQTAPVAEGDNVRVILYLDPKKRLTASMRLPKLQEGGVGRMPVLSVTRQGAFVDLGGERGVLLPFSQMRGPVSPGQSVWVKLYRDKSGRPAVTMLVEDDLKAKARPAVGVKVGDVLTGWVYNELADGFLLFTQDEYIAFLHKDELTGAPPVMGDEIGGRVTFVRPDGRVNISQRPQKELAIDTDAQKILDFLNARNGRMPYGDDTPPEIIRTQFGLSKAAFKRALGQLMKQGKITQRDGWTTLI